MSRPCTSVPIQCAADGAVRRRTRSIRNGSSVAISGANTAPATISAMTARPINERVSRRSVAHTDRFTTSAPASWLAQLGRGVRRLAAPAAVVPEILLRVAPHPALERRGVTCNDRVDIAVAIAGVLDRDALEHEAIL